MALKLKDPTLLRQQCYVDGAWIDAPGGGTIDVTNPATGAVIGTVPNLDAAATRRAHACPWGATSWCETTRDCGASARGCAAAGVRRGETSGRAAPFGDGAH